MPTPLRRGCTSLLLRPALLAPFCIHQNRHRQPHSVVVSFFSSRRRHTRLQGDWSSDVCSSDLDPLPDEGVILPTASVEMFDAQKSVIRQLQIGSPRTGALAAMLADTGWLGSPPREIGRASGRGRGEISVGAGSFKKKTSQWPCT